MTMHFRIFKHAQNAACLVRTRYAKTHKTTMHSRIIGMVCVWEKLEAVVRTLVPIPMQTFVYKRTDVPQSDRPRAEREGGASVLRGTPTKIFP